MGVAKDTYPRDGTTYSFVAGFAEVEVDLETGKPTLIDFLGMADVGTVINPRSLARAARRRELPRDRPRADARSGSTTRTTACRWRSGSITTSR